MKKITVEVTVNAGIEKVWEYWSTPEHITKWAFADETWEAPYAENDLKIGGRFLTKMSAKDGSSGFDFTGVYTNVVPMEKIEFTMDDGRTVSIDFQKIGDSSVRVVEDFEMENENSEELQRSGWQAFMNNFKKHVENN